MKGRWQMIVIGADTHKQSHALAAVDGGTGARVGERTIRAEDAGHRGALRWARELDGERVWAIEEGRHVSRRLEQAPIAAGERVIRVPPHLVGASRRGQREPGKSDRIDALAVARAVLREGIERFAVAFLDERAMQIRLLDTELGLWRYLALWTGVVLPFAAQSYVHDALQGETWSLFD